MLTALNRDHKSLPDATDVHIFLDDKNQIKRYNASSLRWFRLMPQDIGRPLVHIVNEFYTLSTLTALSSNAKATIKLTKSA